MEQDNKDKEELIEEDIIADIASDYAEYLSVESTKEVQSNPQNKFSDTVEEMLMKLDEFGSLVDMIRSDTSLCITKNLPQIQAKSMEMQQVFDKIDKLEAFVTMVRDNVATMEDLVNKAEDEMGSFSGLKKMLSSFVSPKRTQGKTTKGSTYTPPEIFKTEDYFPRTTASVKGDNPVMTDTKTEVVTESKTENVEES